MKFYMIYEQAFPIGFGFCALLCFVTGFTALRKKEPVIIPFGVTYLSHLSALIPLMLLSLNHFLVDWPLGTGTAILNAIGVIGPILLLLWMWFRGFEHTIIGAPPQKVAAALVDLSGGPRESRSRQVVSWLALPFTAITFAPNMTDQPTHEVRETLRSKLRDSHLKRDPVGGALCLIAGSICGLTGLISWALATQWEFL